MESERPVRHHGWAADYLGVLLHTYIHTRVSGKTVVTTYMDATISMLRWEVRTYVPVQRRLLETCLQTHTGPPHHRSFWKWYPTRSGLHPCRYYCTLALREPGHSPFGRSMEMLHRDSEGERTTNNTQYHLSEQLYKMLVILISYPILSSHCSALTQPHRRPRECTSSRAWALASTEQTIRT